MGVFCIAQGTQTGLCGNLEGGMGREAKEGGHMVVPIADSC